MHPCGNTQLQIRKLWVTLISALYIYFFVRLFQYLSIISTRCTTDKTLKETVHFFKTTIIRPSTVPISNVKLKRVSRVYQVLYNDSARNNNISKYQRTEESTRKIRALLHYVYMTKYNQIS